MFGDFVVVCGLGLVDVVALRVAGCLDDCWLCLLCGLFLGGCVLPMGVTWLAGVAVSLLFVVMVLMTSVWLVGNGSACGLDLVICLGMLLVVCIDCLLF